MAHAPKSTLLKSVHETVPHSPGVQAVTPAAFVATQLFE
jgi:hypothetical protein